MSIGAELGQYILQTQFKKKSEDSTGGVWMPTLGTPVGLPKVTARVDNQLKLTFGKLVNKSTHHVWQVDYLTVGVGLGLGLRADCSLNFSQKLANLGNYTRWPKKVSNSQIIKTLC